ncbi:hypothetical protein LWI28_007429 [Acer negundo]|uniref:RRM domain-containing protein n=1 Tax=Acer negundo TaxID=4023 RepID=A0AAD5P4Z0_ACENE|nr:hypothetical protein LWI28_007429 [Acer negundo]
MEDKIATVHKSSGQLFAISPGNTTLFATVFGNGDVVICKAYGSVKVGVPSSLILNVQSEQLAVGREIPIFPLFPEGDLFSFYELCKNYNWTIEDEEVLNFRMGENHGVHLVTSGMFNLLVIWMRNKLVTSESCMEDLQAGQTLWLLSHVISFLIHTLSQGVTVHLSLSVVPDLPLALGVPITWVLPPHYTTSGLLPSSPESRGQWDSQSYKGTITYSILRYFGEKNEPLNEEDISIDGDRIKTRESNNLACIQAKDRSTGRIEIASCVRVAEVAQIRIRNKEIPTLLAVGAELEIPISYYDALGNPFHEAHNAIFYHAETNYRDIVSIDDTRYSNGNIHLKALRHGRALVQVSINNSPRKSDYVLISVGAHVYPLDPVLHVGNDLDFSVQGFNDQVFGHWLSANESVISVDRSSGKAEAVGIGSTQVFFECPSMKLQTMVTVVSRNNVSVDAPKEMLTNVPYPTRGYSFSVSFSDTHKKFAALENKGVSYDCKVEPSFIGYARPWMDLDTGNLYCLFFPYSPEHLVRSIHKSKNMIPYISVSINASLRGAHHVSGSASALFVGGFSVLEMDKNSLQLNLTPDSNKTTITVVGNTDVEIHWDNQDLIKISPIHKEDFGIGGHARYEVKVLGAKKFEDKITITLPANGQRVEIGINYEPEEKVASSTSIKEILSVAILGLCTLISLIAGIVLCNLEKQDRSSPSQPSTSPATPSRTALLTPERSSPGVANEQSPRTPQPFVEYVRRTIDETPYYTREARRSPGKIFIGGLARETTSAQFVKHFGKYGEITDSVIMKDRKTGQPRGFGFVTYADASVVDKVIEDPHIINGKQVEIKRTIPKGAMGSKDFKTRKIFVGGIPSTINEEELKDFFMQYGEVQEHQIMRDHSTSRSRGFGFITFQTDQAVDDLLAKGNKVELAGAQVEIKKAEPKKPNPPPPTSYRRYNNSKPAFGGAFEDAYSGYGGGDLVGVAAVVIGLWEYGLEVVLMVVMVEVNMVHMEVMVVWVLIEEILPLDTQWCRCSWWLERGYDVGLGGGYGGSSGSSYLEVEEDMVGQEAADIILMGDRIP